VATQNFDVPLRFTVCHLPPGQNVRLDLQVGSSSAIINTPLLATGQLVLQGLFQILLMAPLLQYQTPGSARSGLPGLHILSMSPELKNWVASYFALREEHAGLLSSFRVYDPTVFCPYAIVGELMIKLLFDLQPLCKEWFNEWVIDQKSEELLVNSIFLVHRQRWEETQTYSSLKKKQKAQPYQGKNIVFTGMVPSKYRFCENSPRLRNIEFETTLFGAKKFMCIDSYKILTANQPSSLILELDMSACHTRAATLLDHSGTLSQELIKALSTPNFWGDQIAFFDSLGLLDPLQENFNLTYADVKSGLKRGLYTSLNGGNPLSTKNLDKVFEGDFDIDLTDESKLQQAIKDWSPVIDSFQLVKDLKTLHETCAIKYKEEEFSCVYTLAKVEPYSLEKGAHAGISRVLQAIEVLQLVHLSVATLLCGGVILTSDHDGLTALFPHTSLAELRNPLQQKHTEHYNPLPPNHNVEAGNERQREILSSINQTFGILSETPNPIPIEIKRCWYQGAILDSI